MFWLGSFLLYALYMIFFRSHVEKCGRSTRPCQVNDEFPSVHGYIRRTSTSFAKDNLSSGWFLYQDNSPIHKSKLLMVQTVKLSKGEKAHLSGWFAENQVCLIKAPPFSLDLNVIENLWAYVKAKLRGNHFRTKLELWYYMRKVWRLIRREILQ